MLEAGDFKNAIQYFLECKDNNPCDVSIDVHLERIGAVA